MAIEVRDNGPGVPKDIKEKIFHPFFTTKKQGEGTGLGLSISTKTIQEHKGKIELESEEGNGATFRILLPIAEGLPETVETEKGATMKVTLPLAA